MRIYHGADLRKGRFSETERPYLITTVTRDRRPLFCDWRIGRLLVAELRTATENRFAETMAWVVMPDHLHWLMVPCSEPVDAVIRRVKSHSARTINQHMGSNGPLWQKGLPRSCPAPRRGYPNSRALRHRQSATRRNSHRNWRLPSLGCNLAVEAALAANHPCAKMFAGKPAPTKPRRVC
jgi:REP element-mobilizing transposase RayT